MNVITKFSISSDIRAALSFSTIDGIPELFFFLQARVLYYIIEVLVNEPVVVKFQVKDSSGQTKSFQIMK